MPAMRNLKVAVEIGVNPSLKAILTTTKELPQRVMRTSIRNVLKALILLFAIMNNLFPYLLRYIVTCCCIGVVYDECACRDVYHLHHRKGYLSCFVCFCGLT